MKKFSRLAALANDAMTEALEIQGHLEDSDFYESDDTEAYQRLSDRLAELDAEIESFGDDPDAAGWDYAIDDCVINGGSDLLALANCHVFYMK